MKPLNALLAFTFSTTFTGILVAVESPAKHEELQTTASLSVSSPAPQIDIEHWVSPATPELGVVTQFETGKVYVIEFWATWCLPCVGTMPHLAQLQQKCAGQGVQIVSISNEPLETVNKFLDTSVRGQKSQQTYRDLTKAYCLTTDPDHSVHSDYMDAANIKVIPTAFIVGKTGLLEWIGHPKDIDEPLASLVTGDWDREEYRLRWEEERSRKEFDEEVTQMVRDGKLELALPMVDQTYANDEETRHRLKENLYQLNMLTVARSGDEEETIAIAEKLFKRYQHTPLEFARFCNQLRAANRSIKLPGEFLEKVANQLNSQIEHTSGDAKQSVIVSLTYLYLEIGDKPKAMQILALLKGNSPATTNQPSKPSGQLLESSDTVESR